MTTSNTQATATAGSRKQANYTIEQKNVACGGEGRISIVRDNETGKRYAYKQFRQPFDPYFKTKEEQVHCAHKLTELAAKLQSFPADLPAQFVKPLRLQVTKQGLLVGYTMPYLEQGIPLSTLMTRDGRNQNGISMQQLSTIFVKLHGLITELHQKGVVVGDVRPDNILIKNRKPYIIDADSVQFGKFKCKVFSHEWVDPRLCTKQGDMLSRQHSPDEASDWFAFASMLFQGVSGLGPYDGIARTASGLLSEPTRKLQGISVFHPGVKIPPFALKPAYLDPELGKYFERIFRDSAFREPPSIELLRSLDWNKCKETQHEYSSSTCPCGKCATSANLYGLRTIFDSLSMPARVGIAGASLAGALVGYKYFSQGDLQMEGDAGASEVSTSNTTAAALATPKAKDTVAVTAPVSAPVAAPGDATSKTSQLTNAAAAEQSASTTSASSTPAKSASARDNAFLPELRAYASAATAPSGGSATRVTSKVDEPFNYTPQNSVDVSKIHFGAGQRTFHEGNVPVWLKQYPAAAFRIPDAGATQRVSEGALVQAVALGLDAMRNANQGRFPDGSTFTLVVSYQLASGQQEERRFPISESLIPPERELSSEKILRAVNGMRDAWKYVQDNMVVHLAPSGSTHLASAFVSSEQPASPARVYILREP